MRFEQSSLDCWMVMEPERTPGLVLGLIRRAIMSCFSERLISVRYASIFSASVLARASVALAVAASVSYAAIFVVIRV
jgi:hypothetical protein